MRTEITHCDFRPQVSSFHSVQTKGRLLKLKRKASITPSQNL